MTDKNFINTFMPISKKDLQERNIEQLDFVFVSGDAYVDHPSFAVAILGRLLEKNGYTVGKLIVVGKNKLEFYDRQYLEIIQKSFPIDYISPY
jgi:hypothetical protein